MKINLNIDAALAAQARLIGRAKQVPYAASRALNSTAFAVNAALKAEMQSKFKGGATAFTLRAFKVGKATKQSLTATVELRTDSPGKGRPYDAALGHLFTGGSRRWKKMEGAFRRIQALPDGYVMVPGQACPLDSYGNPPTSLIVTLISYFRAFGEQGYRANKTAAGRRRMAKIGTTDRGYKTTRGIEYFISYGRRGLQGDRYVNGRFDQHLPAGIWSRTGVHGADVKPIFRFVRAGHYRQFINLPKVAEPVVARTFHREFAIELSAAMRSAK